MSDIMMVGVLAMPYELAMATELGRCQYWDRAQQALERIAALETEIERLRAELAEAQRDAERYRWLRGDSCADHSVRWTQWEVRCWQAPLWTHDLRRAELDAEIDRARGAE